MTWSGRAVVALVVVLGLVVGMAPVNYAQGRPVVIATSGDAETMDPVLTAISPTGSVQRHMLEPMLAYDPDGKLIPGLVTSNLVGDWLRDALDPRLHGRR